MTTTQKYQDGCRTLLEQAQIELEAEDYRQSAEKAWGAAAQAVKAVCTQRGWRHGSHRRLRVAAKRIAEETGDEEINLLFKAANLLHVNFYEDAYNHEEVSDGIDEVRRFVDKLDALP